MRIVENDPWLAPYSSAIEGRYKYAKSREVKLTNGGSLSDFALGYLYYGLHKTGKEWIFREWAPNATELYLIGDFNNWQKHEQYKAVKVNANGDWELRLPVNAISHGQHYKMYVKWDGGEGERIPAWPLYW